MFAEEFKKAHNIYDIMAISYVHIIQDEIFDYDVESYRDQTFNMILSKYLEDINRNPSMAFINLKQNLILYNNSFSFSSTDFYYLLLGLDSCSEYNYKKSSANSDGIFKTYNSLNSVYANIIRILPVLSDNYRKSLNSIYKKEYEYDYLRDRKSYDTLSINYKLNNHIIYSIDTNNPYDVVVHELVEYEDFINRINEKQSFNIALLPMTSINIHNLLDISYTKNNKFYVNGMYEDVEKQIIDRCKKFMDSLNNIDFLVFPEMLMTNDIIDSIQKHKNSKDIGFVFYGSMWTKYSNICYAFYEGDEIFQYYKKIPFDIKYTKEEFEEVISNCKSKEQYILLNELYGKHDFNKNPKIYFQENIKPEKTIHIIDINKFGRILTFICRDIDDDSYMNISRILQGDFIFLPACSPSDDLADGAGTLSNRYHCTTIMCNTCSTLCKNSESLNRKIENKNNIGFIVTPSKSDTTRSHKKIFYTFDETCKDCNSYCNGRIFNVDLEELKLEDKSVYLNITEIGR